MLILEYWKLAISKYAQFTGRSRRSEYWYFSLFNAIVGILLGLVLGLISEQLALVANLYSLAVMIPGIAVGVRRLHDVGRSGWWMLIALTGIGAFVLLYWFVKDSEPGNNEYGPNPKTGNSDELLDHLVS